MVITRTTRNRFAFTGTWVRIPPSPFHIPREISGFPGVIFALLPAVFFADYILYVIKKFDIIFLWHLQ